MDILGKYKTKKYFHIYLSIIIIEKTLIFTCIVSEINILQFRLYYW